MPFCPKCRYEYVDGIAVCPDCDVPLERVLPPESPRETKAAEDIPTLLITAGNMPEADVLRAILESAGIPVYVQHSRPTTDYGMLSMQRGVPVFVPQSRISDAEDALRQATEGGKEIEHDVWQSREYNREEEGQERE